MKVKIIPFATNILKNLVFANPTSRLVRLKNDKTVNLVFLET